MTLDHLPILNNMVFPIPAPGNSFKASEKARIRFSEKGESVDAEIYALGVLAGETGYSHLFCVYVRYCEESQVKCQVPLSYVAIPFGLIKNYEVLEKYSETKEIKF